MPKSEIEIKTRSGLLVRIYAEDGAAPFQLHGAIQLETGWVSYEWTADGFRDADHTPTEWDIAESILPAPPVSWRRCPGCCSTGRRPDGSYCGCEMGRDLRLLETRCNAAAVAQAGVVN